MRRYWVAVSLSMGCGLTAGTSVKSSQAAALAQGQANIDDTALKQVDAARAKAKAYPRAAREARSLATAIQSMFQLGTVERKHLDVGTLLTEASSAVDAA